MVPPSQSVTVQVAVEALDRLAYASVKITLLHLATGKSKPPPPPPSPPYTTTFWERQHANGGSLATLRAVTNMLHLDL